MKGDYTTNFLIPDLYIFSLKGWENVLFQLGSEKVNLLIATHPAEDLRHDLLARVPLAEQERQHVHEGERRRNVEQNRDYQATHGAG